MVSPPRPGMVKIQVWGYACLRCEHEWVPRVSSGTAEPLVCPACKSPWWNRARRPVCSS